MPTTSKSKGTTTPAAVKAAIRARALGDQKRPPTHPGEVFRLEYRELQNPPVSQAEAARRLGWSNNRMNEFEMGKRGVTPDNAIALAELTGTSPEFWMHLQETYDLWHALQRSKGRSVLVGEPFASTR
jgi:addiction module HigA family antidote